MRVCVCVCVCGVCVCVCVCVCDFHCVCTHAMGEEEGRAGIKAMVVSIYLMVRVKASHFP